MSTITGPDGRTRHAQGAPASQGGRFAAHASAPHSTSLSVAHSEAQADREATADVRAIASERIPGVERIVFELNYTDEGAYLMSTGYVTRDDKTFHALDATSDELTSDIFEAGSLIDNTVYARTGAGDDGTQLPGMHKDPEGVDRYYLLVAPGDCGRCGGPAGDDPTCRGCTSAEGAPLSPVQRALAEYEDASKEREDLDWDDEYAVRDSDERFTAVLEDVSGEFALGLEEVAAGGGEYAAQAGRLLAQYREQRAEREALDHDDEYAVRGSDEEHLGFLVSFVPDAAEILGKTHRG